MILEMAISSAEGCFLHIFLMYADLVITRAEIDLGEHPGTMELVSEVINQGDWESIFDGDVVEGMIINAHSQIPILLFDEEHWGTIRGYTWFNRSIG
jgi:hypothetical protein